MADWVCATCSSINRDSAAACYSCGNARPSAVSAPTPADPGAPMLATPDGQVMAPPAAEPVLPFTAGLLGGLVGGAVAAALATVVWFAVVAFSGWQVGLVAIVVGWLVGQGVVFGAERRVSVPLVAASAVFTLLALTLSEYLITYHFVSQALGAENVIGVIQSPAFVIDIVVDSVTSDPLTLVFWAIALFQAVVIPWRAMTRPSAG